MSNLRVAIRDNSGNECPIEINRTFRFRQKIDAMVRKLSG